MYKVTRTMSIILMMVSLVLGVLWLAPVSGSIGAHHEEWHPGAFGTQGPKGGMAGLNGANGINGKNGVNGTNGVNGINGKNGVNGTNGVNGKNGLKGTNGINGKNGVNGTNGPPGTPSEVIAVFPTNIAPFNVPTAFRCQLASTDNFLTFLLDDSLEQNFVPCISTDFQTATQQYRYAWQYTAFNSSLSTFIDQGSGKGYGVYKNHPPTFNPRETIVLYLEPEGYFTKPIKQEGGTMYNINFTTQIMVSNSRGIKVVPPPETFSISSHHENTEVYVIVPLHPLSIADYVIRYVVTDNNSSGKPFTLIKYIKVTGAPAGNLSR
jgi:hypothetical protein